MVVAVTVDQNAPAGLRERKKLQTRGALSWAVIRLSVERGWHNVTMDDAAAAANVSGRTFRNYFSTKAGGAAPRPPRRYARERGRPARPPGRRAAVGRDHRCRADRVRGGPAREQ